jgi:diguanylate cyclase (GGDEF)-like protein
MRVLIAEDEPVSRRVLEAMLRRLGYDVVTAANGQEAWQCLQAGDAPGLAILGRMMPGMDGVQVCREVRKRGQKGYTYILLLAAKGDGHDIVEGLEAGADDYLFKPFDNMDLKARLSVGRRILELHSQLLHVCEELRNQATHDWLTGVWNRGAILGMLEQLAARAFRERLPIGIIMTDVDRFKRINDTLGHAAGDAVLRETAQRLIAVVRPYDSLGRYGGEEFLILAPGCDGPTTVMLAERLRQQVEASPFRLGQQAVPITISLGATSFEGQVMPDVATLLQVVDAALHHAKNSGRNRVVFAAPDAGPGLKSGGTAGLSG